jgi:RHS repeat-associated protein
VHQHGELPVVVGDVQLDAGGAARYGWLGTHQRSTDALAGLTLMGVRLYNSVTGQFLSRDPIRGGNATAYSYPVDPLGSTDLSGRYRWSHRRSYRRVWAVWHWITYRIDRIMLRFNHSETRSLSRFAQWSAAAGVIAAIFSGPVGIAVGYISAVVYLWADIADYFNKCVAVLGTFVSRRVGGHWLVLAGRTEPWMYTGRGC